VLGHLVVNYLSNRQ